MTSAEALNDPLGSDVSVSASPLAQPELKGWLGAFLGVWGVTALVFLGSVFALLVFGPISYLTGRLIPLGIFLAAGAAITYGWGDAMLEWYLGSVLGVP